MAYAAITFVYNEAVNLPIWVKYYGEMLGFGNLFVIDRSSDDGSTDGLGAVNLIRIPRDEFDEDAKTNLMSSFHAALTSIYDAVIVTDCDEILVPDPARYRNLPDYIIGLKGDYVNAIGIDILHIINQEPPLDITKPILSQRTYGRFYAPECKQLLSRVPIKWLPGLHSSNMPPNFDTDLLLFHLKLMDYSIATQRQIINISTEWSAKSLKRNLGAHHRYTLSQFVKEGFFVPIDLLGRNEVGEFDFNAEVADLRSRTIVDAQGYHRVPTNISKLVVIPERFRSAL